jgi:CRISPR/Cas system-associated endoribonuclease Cas2
LFKNIGKIFDRVQAKSTTVDTSVFNSRLIKMLVMEELSKIKMEWEEFITSSNFQISISPTPQYKVKIPLQVDTTVHFEVNKKRKNIGYTNKDKEKKKHVEEGEYSQSP